MVGLYQGILQRPRSLWDVGSLMTMDSLSSCQTWKEKDMWGRSVANNESIWTISKSWGNIFIQSVIGISYSLGWSRNGGGNMITSCVHVKREIMLLCIIIWLFQLFSYLMQCSYLCRQTIYFLFIQLNCFDAEFHLPGSRRQVGQWISIGHLLSGQTATLDGDNQGQYDYYRPAYKHG